MENQTKEVLQEILDKLTDTAFSGTACFPQASNYGFATLRMTAGVKTERIEELFARYGVKKSEKEGAAENG